MKKLFLIIMTVFMFAIVCVSADKVSKKNVLIKKEQTKIVPITSWLFLGPAKPELINNNPMDINNILSNKYINLNKLIPRKGEIIQWNKNLQLKWKPLKDGIFRSKNHKILYFATYIKTNRWLSTKLVLGGQDNAYKVFLNGKNIKLNKEKNYFSTQLKLTNEKHLLLIKVITNKDKQFIFKPYFELKSPFNEKNIISSIKSKHPVNTKNILNTNNITSVSLSKKGKYAKVGLSKVDIYTKKTNRWLEILKVSNGDLMFSSKNIGSISGFRWLKSPEKFSYTKNEKGKTSIYIYNIKNKSQRLVLADIKDFSTYWWSSNNRFFIYSTTKIFGDNKNYKHIKDLPFRAKHSGYKSALHIVYINKSSDGLSSVTHELTNYKKNYDSVSISPDSKKIILSRLINDYKQRPYLKYSTSILELKSGKIDKLINSYWLNGLVWSPNSKQLLMTGGPSSFNNIGNALPKDIIPNDYDGQMFIYDLKTKKATQLSKNFNPSIGSVYWKQSNIIYFKAIDKSYSRIFKYNIKKNKFKKLKTSVDVVRALDIIKHTAVYSGSSTTRSSKLYKLNLSSNSVSLIKDYNKNMFKDVSFGKCKDWDFISKAKRVIKGRLYYPPNFDKNKKYPCIVYYYGGTSPVTREFGGRYPKNWYASHGYIVYVLQPTGAIGFGQKASSAHVNDWGKITSEEIIEGIGKLVKEHKYIDAKKIGSMGASYGGFLTQYLATQTDTIAAFISHAGISDLSSYWGVGEWGYLYSGIASAESFPWNRKDLYIGHSPLYMVDRIKNPILLLHGDSDNNVPPGESYQMYAALKLAGKEASLITFKGQKHFILEYTKRLRWMRTIIAWFDKWLKDEPEHWNEMYK